MDEAFSIGRGEGHIKVRISMYLRILLPGYLHIFYGTVGYFYSVYFYLGLSDAFLVVKNWQ